MEWQETKLEHLQAVIDHPQRLGTPRQVLPADRQRHPDHEDNTQRVMAEQRLLSHLAETEIEISTKLLSCSRDATTVEIHHTMLVNVQRDLRRRHHKPRRRDNRMSDL